MSDVVAPRIYVACLSSYNNGYLHGRWIDASTDTDEMQEEVNAMLKASPMPDAEEWAIHDYEGFEGLELGEYAGLDRVAEAVGYLEACQEAGIPVAVMQKVETGIDMASLESLIDAYGGKYDSPADYAEELFIECYSMEIDKLPPMLIYHIDWESVARDMELEGDTTFVEHEGYTYVFNGY